MKLSWRDFINFGFIFELLLYAFSLFLAIGITLNLAIRFPTQQTITDNGMSAWQFIILFLLATAILLIILKYFKKPWLIKGLFYLAIFEGLWIFSQAYFDWPHYIVVVIVIILFWLIYQNILIHDVVIVLAISAISVIFGVNFMPSTLVIILLLLAFYDFWAVYKTKHMVKMFRGLAEAKVHFALIVPQRFKGLFKKVKQGEGEYIATLYVHKDSKRAHKLGSRKIRAEKVKVVEIVDMNGNPFEGVAMSPTHSSKIEYRKGKEIFVDNFCDDIREECVPGIHGFLTIQEAKEW